MDGAKESVLGAVSVRKTIDACRGARWLGKSLTQRRQDAKKERKLLVSVRRVMVLDRIDRMIRIKGKRKKRKERPWFCLSRLR